MSSDAASLRVLLSNTDLSAPSIQGAAKAMLRQYDKAPLVAVTEWRHALHQARVDQFLPLLYVANEVLQQSKRNRGNKFLEAFTPTLGQSLVFMCQKGGTDHPAMVEKIRRTVKIWGERHVFSVRYVNGLIKGLDAWRRNGSKSASGNKGSNAGSGGAAAAAAAAAASPNSVTAKKSAAVAATPSADADSSDDNDDDALEMSPTDDNDDDDDDDDDDLFGGSESKLLKIDVNLDRAAASSAATATANNKRRRSSMSSTESVSESKRGGSGSSRRRLSMLSTNSLMELWNSVSTVQSKFDSIQASVKDLHGMDETTTASGQPVDSLVGDELLQEYKKVVQREQRLVRQRRELHAIANTKQQQEQQAVRYLPWLEQQLQQDQEDFEFCNKYRRQLQLFHKVHGPAWTARDQRLKEEARLQRLEEEAMHKKQEEEERRKFMESAMAKQTEAQPGMVWNKATGEYQYLNQEESWRD